MTRKIKPIADVKALTTAIDLTVPQINVLRFMVDANDSGWSASVRDICNRFGWSSPNAAHQHLRRLDAKGLIELQGGRRSARVTELAMSLYSRRGAVAGKRGSR